MQKINIKNNTEVQGHDLLHDCFDELDNLAHIVNLLGGSLHLLDLLDEDISDNGLNEDNDWAFDIALTSMKKIKLDLCNTTDSLFDKLLVTSNA